MIVQSGLNLTLDLAEPENNTVLVRLDSKEARKSPRRDSRERDQHNASSAEIATRKPGPELLLRASDLLFEIRLLRIP
jgi:hypothetical protein